MGQYYHVVNIDKKEFLDPHSFGDGLKLMEFGLSGMGTLSGLTILLADGNGQGGGDLDSEDCFIGRWAGDRIVITGDYAEEGKFVENPEVNLYHVTGEEEEGYKDISAETLYALLDDSYYMQECKEQLEKGHRYLGKDLLADLIKIKECKANKLPLLLGSPSGKDQPITTDGGRRVLEREMKRKLG